jgi:uncharacterized protein (TIGR02145 family)
MRIVFTCFLISWIFSTVFSQKVKTVQIGNQEWGTSNLSVKRFQNRDKIKFANSQKDWKDLCDNKTPAYCYFNFQKKDEKGYGCYYNWYAVNDLRGIAPKEFSIPTVEQLQSLDTLLSNEKCSSEIKSKIGWGGSGTNSTGMNIIASGGYSTYGNWSEITAAHFWTSFGTFENGRALGWHVYENCSGMSDLTGEWSNADEAYSIRCIKR